MTKQESKGNSRFPLGMTSKKGKGNSRFPSGMTKQESKGNSRSPSGMTSKKGNSRFPLEGMGLVGSVAEGAGEDVGCSVYARHDLIAAVGVVRSSPGVAIG